MQIRENVPISELTTMRLGGPARFVVSVEQPTEIAEAWQFAKDRHLPIWVMGGGANTIGHDEGFPGVIILSQIKGLFTQTPAGEEELAKIDPSALGETLTIRAMSGEIWDDLVAASCSLNYSGIEALSMIPGTVGAAPVQNIGAYGQDISQVIETVEAFDTRTETFVTLPKDELFMTYRHTRFNHGVDAGRFIISAITIKVHRGTLEPPFYTSLQAYIEQHRETNFSPANIRRMVCAIRAEKLPDPTKIASAGSFFGNIYLDATGVVTAEAKGIPVWRSEAGGKINAGWLIEACGLKGKLLHGFRVSDKAALVLINESATNYHDLDLARKDIINAVYERFGYQLEQEPVEIPNHTVEETKK